MSDALPIDPRLEARAIENIRVLREHRGWSQSELARRVADAGWPKYTQMTVSRTEKGERPIRLDEAATLAQVFGIELSDLWMDEGQRQWQEGLATYRAADNSLVKAQEEYADAVFRLALVADELEAAGQMDNDASTRVDDAIALTPAELFWASRVERQRRRTPGSALDAIGGRFSAGWRAAYVATEEEVQDYAKETGEDDA